MSNGKQQPSAIDGLDADGNSASDEHTSSSSAIGANFSIRGPILCRCFRNLLRSTLSVSVQCKSRLLSLLHCFFCSGDSIKGTMGPELAFFTGATDGYDRHVVGKRRVRFGDFIEVDGNRSARQLRR
jgi:hypothetical protein